MLLFDAGLCAERVCIVVVDVLELRLEVSQIRKPHPARGRWDDFTLSKQPGRGDPIIQRAGSMTRGEKARLERCVRSRVRARDGTLSASSAYSFTRSAYSTRAVRTIDGIARGSVTSTMRRPWNFVYPAERGSRSR